MDSICMSIIANEEEIGAHLSWSNWSFFLYLPVLQWEIISVNFRILFTFKSQRFLNAFFFLINSIQNWTEHLLTCNLHSGISDTFFISVLHPNNKIKLCLHHMFNFPFHNNERVQPHWNWTETSNLKKPNAFIMKNCITISSTEVGYSFWIKSFKKLLAYQAVHIQWFKSKIVFSHSPQVAFLREQLHSCSCYILV